MQIHQYKCFGRNHASGNIALVVIDNNDSVSERQDFARNVNLPVCVFIDDVTIDSIKVSFYYSDAVKVLCLHGALAAAKWFFDHYLSISQITMITSIGKCIIARKVVQNVFLELKCEFIDPAIKYNAYACELLNLSKNNVLDAAVASVGSPKLLIELASKEQLITLNPDLLSINNWGQQNDVNGLYVYYREQQFIYARSFNHLVAMNEDAATGVAASALCAYLGRDVIVHQGSNLDNNCELIVHYMAGKVQLSGLVTVM